MYRFQTKNWLQKQQMIEEEERDKMNASKTSQPSQKMTDDEYERLKKQYEMSSGGTPKLLYPTTYHIKQTLKTTPTTATNVTDSSFTQHGGFNIKQEPRQDTFAPSSFDSDLYSQDLDQGDLESESRPYSPSSIASSEVADDISMNFLNFDGIQEQTDVKMDMEVQTNGQMTNQSINGVLPIQNVQGYGLNPMNPMNPMNPIAIQNVITGMTDIQAIQNLQNVQNPLLMAAAIGGASSTQPVPNGLFTFNPPINQMSNTDWMNIGNQNQVQLLTNPQINFNSGSTPPPKQKSSSRSTNGKVEDIKLDEDLANEKLRRRRESHNAVERRRRDNINERINELSILVPECLDANGTIKPNKGLVLRKSAEYIRFLQETNRKYEQLIQSQQQQILQQQALLEQSKANST